MRIEARCYRRGGVGALVTTPADALDYAVNFPASVRESASILQVLCQPYDKLLSFPTAMEAVDMMILQKQARVLQSLWERYEQISRQIADVDYILLHPQQFYRVDVAVLKAGKAQLEQQLEEVHDQAIKYARNTIKSVSASDFAPIYLALPMRGVELKSAVGMDYTKLQDLLVAGNSKEADAETGRVMLAVAKRQKVNWLDEDEGYLDSENMEDFPCEDLRTIDQLWIKYSDGRFGFSVQKRIYQSLGADLTGINVYNSSILEAFGDKVGWRKGGEWLYYKDITFDKKAPEAHLPEYTKFELNYGFGRGYGYCGLGIHTLLNSRPEL